MKRFLKLLVPHSHGPGEQQKLARARFPGVVGQSNLRLWQPGDHENVNRRIVIGLAASYSIPDLELLDVVDDAIQAGGPSLATVEVFDVLDCREMSDFEKYIPGVTPVYQTPVVGIWEQGVLRAVGSGAVARDLILSAVGRAPSPASRPPGRDKLT